MPFDPEIHHRKSIRLEGYDYSQPGAYFVTIVTFERIELFGVVQGNEMNLSPYGQTVQRIWNYLPRHFSYVELGAFCLMPNHLHAVVVMIDSKAAMRPLPEIVRWFKTTSARRINEQRQTPRIPVWQRNYYEHIIRSAKELDQIDLYIKSNPDMWAQDSENPDQRL